MHVPLALKIWLGRMGLLACWEYYQRLEKAVLIDRLASWETSLLEDSLRSSLAEHHL